MRGEVFPLSAAGLSIGRDAGNDVVVSDRALSRRHCRLSAQSGAFMISDLGSRNGTFVNGMPVREQSLHDRDQISLGNSILLFQLDDERPAEQPPVEVEEDDPAREKTVTLHGERTPYLQPDSMSRVARSLNLLLTIAGRIAGIHDTESLAWQVLGLTFDAIPADRGALLLLSNGPEEFAAAAAWDRASGPNHPVRVNGAIVREALRERIAITRSEPAAKQAGDGGS